MALIKPKERRYVPPSPDERARFAAEALAARAESEAKREALKPARRVALAVGPPLRDIEAAVDCGCSCHPSPGRPDKHEGGGACRCQQTDADRKAVMAKLSSFFDGDEYEAERLRDEQVTEELHAEAERLGVTATVAIQAAPFVITGVCDGRAFYLRERHGSWRVTIATDDDPLADPWGSELEDATLEIAAGDDDEFNDEAGRFSHGIALRVAITCVRDALLRNGCQHETPNGSGHRFCRSCGVTLALANAWRWSTGGSRVDYEHADDIECSVGWAHESS